MIMPKEHYINAYNRFYDKCLTEAKENQAEDVSEAADTLFADNAGTDEIVGYYIILYSDLSLKTWLENLNYALEKRKITDKDNEVTSILTELFS